MPKTVGEAGPILSTPVIVKTTSTDPANAQVDWAKSRNLVGKIIQFLLNTAVRAGFPMSIWDREQLANLQPIPLIEQNHR